MNGFFVRRPQYLTTDSSNSRLEEINIASDDTGLIHFDSQAFDNNKKNIIASSSITDKKLANSSFEDLIPGGVLTRSSRKALRFSPKKTARKTAEGEGFSLVEMSLVQFALSSAAICSWCKSAKSEIIILKDNSRRHGMAEMFIFKCSLCQHETKTYSSAKIDNGTFEVNRRSVVACNTMIGGRKVLSDFCGIMNLPTLLASASYARHLKFVAQSGRQEADLIMNKAAERIRKCILTKNPNDFQKDMDGGTWQKRGFTSKYGVVDHQLSLLIQVKWWILKCFRYIVMSAENIQEVGRKTFQDMSNRDYKGSSGGMEGDYALKIFNRSISERNLKYTSYICRRW